MKKILLISSLIFSTLFADNSLGTPLYNPTLKPQQGIKSYNKNVDNLPKATNPKYSKHKFKKDDHRYNKRYSNFDYETHGYYNDDGYYYGYYDSTGYFYDNIFFTYNSQYTYYDRVHLRGRFRPHYQHHRVYEYHVVNDWNRVHCYREPNRIVYGHYYDRPSSYRESYRSSYYNDSPRYYNNNHRYSHDNARMYTNRDSYYQRERRDQREHHYRNDNHRYRSRNERRSDTRMRTRNSSNSHRTTTHQNHNYGNKSNQHSTSHMQLSR